VIVAHRPETIAMADRVVEVAGGRIAADSARVAPAPASTRVEAPQGNT